MLPQLTAWSRHSSPSASTPSTTSSVKRSSSKMGPSSSQERSDQPKKPRHRHSAVQLAALNALYDKNEHPSLEERTSLAERLGMETKTVNSWFQNKRASSKKRHAKASSAVSTAPTSPGSAPLAKAQPSHSSSVELPPISALLAQVPAGMPPLSLHEYDDYSDDEHLHRLATPNPASLAFYATPHKQLPDAELGPSRKARSRPSAVQTEELRKVYDANPHPTKEEREQLGMRIGMRYQSVTNWFQNQRSIAKKRREDEDAHFVAAPVPLAHSPPALSRPRTFSPFPPALGAAHPSLAVPPATQHPSLAFPLVHHALPVSAPRARRSSSVGPSRPHSHGVSRSSSRPVSPRVLPYQTPSERSHASRGSARPRRTRPEPHQLDALKKLFRRTATPSIEERGALALEIGMDVGKVTNWFRNLRQTARKRARSRGLNPDGEEDELEEGELVEGAHDVDMDVDADDVSLATNNHSRSVSRSATPVHSLASSGPSPVMNPHFPPPPPPYSLDDADAPQQRPFRGEFRGRESASPYARARQGAPRTVYDAYARGRHQIAVLHEMQSSSSSLGRHSDGEAYAYADADSHNGSEEDAQEALTPSPVSSPPPSVSVEIAHEAEKPGERKPAVKARLGTGVKVEDALLLLSFHHTVAH
ncbi:homeobox-domain-containing protein [Wolfiporia cocos MD-104 SS10]|uniref:Homeobox-domain-containing protein n=1 Tax=Wolfiporia cocos (strain MD-104) TaxID=742152 RepID=A0A2H3IVR2_WOLCO|nr:homeobox-domain-containing protein [Wolfiporia cocos MD-104 SS10]